MEEQRGPELQGEKRRHQGVRSKDTCEGPRKNGETLRDQRN